MTTDGRPLPTREDRARDLKHNERVRHARMRRDARRGPAANLAEGIALTELAQRLLGAARVDRR
ncbi:MAG: hypothetical protein MSC31_14480 [Solirubrobacteraceae bacterium MAG38_C4-C5]|nr:hypothetical protein [Candidatus Siliceabacter maunaloa]